MQQGGCGETSRGPLLEELQRLLAVVSALKDGR